MRRQIQKWVFLSLASLVGGGCAESPDAASTVETESAVAIERSQPEKSSTPFLKRMPASTYGNAIRDLFEGMLSHDDLLELGPLPLAIELNNFDNNAAVDVASPTLVEAYHNRAVLISEFLLAELEDHFGCGDEVGEALQTCMEKEFEAFATRAWRRPLEQEERALIAAMNRDWVQEFGRNEGDALTLQFILQSPHFFYYPEFGNPEVESPEGYTVLTPHELASRMAALLWDSIPDAALMAAAESGGLDTSEGIAEEARRMLSDWRGQQGVQNFYRQLLEFDAIGGNSVDFSVYFPEIAAEDASDYLHQVIQPAMRSEAELFVNREIFHGSGTLGGLLSSNRSYLNEPLADLYETEPAEDAPGFIWMGQGEAAFFLGPLRETELDPAKRAGFLTLSGFLNSHAKPAQPSPVERGVYILDRFLCNKPSPPPDQVPDLDEASAAAEVQTNRDKYAKHTSDPLCAGCHVAIDGIGFTFENYDSMGAWRDMDNGFPVDATGELVGTDLDGPLSDAVELAHTLAGSRTVHDCHVTNWTRYALGRSTDGMDRVNLDALKEGFWQSNGDIRSLLVNLVTNPLFRTTRSVQ